MAQLLPEVEEYLRKLAAPLQEEYYTGSIKKMADIQPYDNLRTSAIYLMSAARMIINGFYPSSIDPSTAALRIYFELRYHHIEFGE
jgi:hypothetical protein